MKFSVRSRRLRRSTPWLVALAALALIGVAGAGVSAERSSAPANAAVTGGSGLVLPGLGGKHYRITLLTGDVVTLDAAVGGGHVAAVEPALRPDGSKGSIRISGFDEDLYAIPEDAEALIKAGKIDKELFNVGYLAANGYADASRGTLPLIAEYTERLSAATEQQRADSLPASNVTNMLESIDAAALAVSKSEAETFWSTLRGSPAAKASLETGITKLWLDRRVKVALDESVPQIGAPAAWAAGYDGTGVKVAVLDTGIDEVHPDVAGKVVASRSFITGQAVADGHGHGTHVAATVAGSGAAEGGLRKGVAPGAQLVIGKVLANNGSGPDSQVIQGMEWAAIEQNADVVNMSLGAPATDGTDPVSQAVNRLTRDTGALFVISAGNAGRSGDHTVGTPGAADEALTVAAVDKDDRLADFSSRGPRRGDEALKPDIAAPGVGIVAARAAGTSLGSPVNAFYTSLNGTSMAAPHVAGAAAILAQKYPDWTAAQLKPALMSTSKDAGFTVYEQGAGRVDVARAVTQQVLATTANVDFKFIPFDDRSPRIGSVSYANLSAQPVTLDLALELQTLAGAPAPADALTVSEASPTVPAGGSAAVDVTVDPERLELGTTYTGSLVATTAEGARVTTPVGLTVGEETFKLTITVIRRQKDAGPWKRKVGLGLDEYRADVSVVGVGGSAADAAGQGSVSWNEPADPKHSVTFPRVPKGTYHAQALTHWHFENQRHAGFLFDPEFEVDGDTEITLDADDAKPITIETPEPSEASEVVALITRTTVNGNDWRWHASPNFGTEQQLWATPTGAVSTGSFSYASQYVLTAPRVAAAVVSPVRMDLHPVPSAQISETRPDFTSWGSFKRREVVYAGLGTAEDFARVDARGKLVLLRVQNREPHNPDLWYTPVVSTAQVERAAEAGAIGILFHPEEGLLGTSQGLAAPYNNCQFASTGCTNPVPFAILPAPEADRLIGLIDKGPVMITMQGTHRRETPYAYSIKPYEEGRIRSNLTYEFEKDDLARIDATVHDAPLEGGPQINGVTRVGVATRRPNERVTFPAGFQIPLPPHTVPIYVGPIYRNASYDTTVHGLAGGSEHSNHGLDEADRVDAHFGVPPVVPGVPALAPIWAANTDSFTLCSGCRQGDVFYPLVLATKPQRHLVSNVMGSNLDAVVRLFRNGVEVQRQAGFAELGFDMSPEPARYRFTLDERGSQSAWEFTSSSVIEDETPRPYACVETAFVGTTTPCRAEQLVFLTYNAELGLDNKARAGRSGEIRVTAYHHESDGPKIVGLKLWVSTDDGADWDQVKVKSRGKGVFEADVRYPQLSQTTGAVSLKAEAWDVAGNRVDQTVMRAFGLREGSGGGDDDDDDD